MNNDAVKGAHTGIALYDAAAGKYLTEHNAAKNFIPASTLKLFTLYESLKYLGDSLSVGSLYEDANGNGYIFPRGDPSFLHPDFKTQPVAQLLSQYDTLFIVGVDSISMYAPGWAWEDAREDFMRQRTAFPMYGNLRDSPFVAPPVATYLTDTLHNTVYAKMNSDLPKLSFKRELFSFPLDFVLRPMMYNSDNFFAEQLLLMVDKARHGKFIDAVPDTLVKPYLLSLPDRPRWVDGSGLSRYNLFSPRDFVSVLQQLRDSFGDARLRRILPPAGAGTLRNYFEGDSNFIWAKTGSMSGIYCISGYLISRKGKLLLFSVMVNNAIGSLTPVRRAVEQLLIAARNFN